ncbi:hypothetical protein B0A48_08230 [Cryoendolithus antarcticus]|uniref:Major facilitator superfamily (MFS) profile domain-containing protein n=1 Tax=Cryoendolithus antarcticus TaxID=1507870 RepID=A0A1V8T4V1_9PEZI|nr:hypothetical protein B0A48_08230 [Cryoendolithus antarcticus]
MSPADPEKGQTLQERPNYEAMISISTLDDESRPSTPHSEQYERHSIDIEAAAQAHNVSPSLKRTQSNKSAVLARIASRITTRSIANPPPPPDGGLKAWTQVGCAWLVLFTTWGYVNSFGSFQTYYSTLLPNETASTISWIGSVQVWLTFFVGAFSGRLLDAGLFLPTFMVGMAMQLAGIFGMSWCTEYWQLMLTQGILTGIGGGIFFCPSMGLLATYFDGRRGVAIGIATTGNSVGGMIYPVVVRELLPKLGFAWTVRIIGFVNLGCLVLALCFMRPRLPPRKSGPIMDPKAFHEPVYMLFVAGFCFMIGSVYWTFYYIASFGVQVIGLSYASSTLLIIIINGVGLPFRVIPPLLSDRYGPLNIILPALFATALVAFTFVAVHDTIGLYLFTIFYGITTAAFQCLLPVTVASLTTNLNMVGTRLGMAFSAISFAALTWPPIGGAIIGLQHGKYQGAQIWAAVSALAGALLMLTARVKMNGWTVRKKC